MGMTDPIADMLTRIRNANKVFHEDVKIPYSRMKEEIARILRDEGYIKDYEVQGEKGPGKSLCLTMKYSRDRERVISGLKRISKPGLRIYCKVDQIPRVLGGLGCCIVSTSRGIMTGPQCREKSVGGEVICYVW